ncbi:hypothetical protein [Blastococcus brunescens]|uniref:Uncharacterized protein n=1 Tax=Blastococcus brunescens TaxID=1564165 RepID=A0ABZ1AY39_9ACTN|nr:hypothetical protein [Blastococcus sp. BMG 8361]WRL63425.1 hypothetical protein U6N30_27460 [Blastococcus sp. BMG 8361]
MPHRRSRAATSDGPARQQAGGAQEQDGAEDGEERPRGAVTGWASMSSCWMAGVVVAPAADGGLGVDSPRSSVSSTGVSGTLPSQRSEAYWSSASVANRVPPRSVDRVAKTT